jgi:hypothetical protein
MISFEQCLTAGLYTRSVMLRPDFRLPGESTLLIGQPLAREVLIFCHKMQLV